MGRTSLLDLGHELMEITVNDKKVIIERGTEKDYLDLHNAFSKPTGRVEFRHPYFKAMCDSVALKLRGKSGSR